MTQRSFASPQPVRVLLAEDDAAIRRALRWFLEFLGYRVREAEDGSQCLAVLSDSVILSREEPVPDVLITDIRMPGLNGLTLLENMRAGGWRIPTVVITGFGEPELRSRVEHLTHTRYLEKPFDPDALESAIQSLLHDERSVATHALP